MYKGDRVNRYILQLVFCSFCNLDLIVLCHSLIYGQGQGINAESIQVPGLIELAKKTGKASHIGKGENIWSHVHIDDVAQLYLLAIENSPAGSFFYVENGKASIQSPLTG